MSVFTRFFQRVRNPGFRAPVLKLRCMKKVYNPHRSIYERCNRPIDVTENARWNIDRCLATYTCHCGQRSNISTRFLLAFRRGFTSPDALKRHMSRSS